MQRVHGCSASRQLTGCCAVTGSAICPPRSSAQRWNVKLKIVETTHRPTMDGADGTKCIAKEHERDPAGNARK